MIGAVHIFWTRSVSAPTNNSGTFLWSLVGKLDDDDEYEDRDDEEEDDGELDAEDKSLVELDVVVALALELLELPEEELDDDRASSLRSSRLSMCIGFTLGIAVLSNFAESIISSDF